IDRVTNKFNQAHPWTAKGYLSAGKLFFSPAANEACHGMPHPTGTSAKCFLRGRYRFGAALYPGFHYDVSGEDEVLTCRLYDCEGRVRDLKPERRRYINIFPNDHLLPELS